MSAETGVRGRTPRGLDDFAAVDVRITGRTRMECCQLRVGAAGRDGSEIDAPPVVGADGQVFGFLPGNPRIPDGAISIQRSGQKLEIRVPRRRAES